MPNMQNPIFWALIALAPTLFILLLALIFNDLTVGVLVIVLLGFSVSGFFFLRARQLAQEAYRRDNPSRRPERRRSRSRAKED